MKFSVAQAKEPYQSEVIDCVKHRQFVHPDHSRILEGGQLAGDQGGKVRNRTGIRTSLASDPPRRKGGSQRCDVGLDSPTDGHADSKHSARPVGRRSEVHLALQLYERDPEVVRLVQKQLANVSR